MLGVLHKCTLGIAYPSLAYMFPAVSPTQTQTRYYTRLGSRRHNKQILDRCQGDQLEFFRRSLFGLVGVYNLLPQDVVDLKSVKSFQSALTAIAREQCRNSISDMWKFRFSRIPGYFYN